MQQQEEQLQKTRRQQLRAIGKQLLPTFRKKDNSEERSLVSTAPSFRSYVVTPPEAAVGGADIVDGGCNVMKKEVNLNSSEIQQEAGINNITQEMNRLDNCSLQNNTSPDMNDWLLIDRMDTITDNNATLLQPSLSPSKACRQGSDEYRFIFNPSFVGAVSQVDTSFNAPVLGVKRDNVEGSFQTKSVCGKISSESSDGHNFKDACSQNSVGAATEIFGSIFQYDPFEISRQNHVTASSDLMKFDRAGDDHRSAAMMDGISSISDFASDMSSNQTITTSVVRAAAADQADAAVPSLAAVNNPANNQAAGASILSVADFASNQILTANHTATSNQTTIAADQTISAVSKSSMAADQMTSATLNTTAATNSHQINTNQSTAAISTAAASANQVESHSAADNNATGTVVSTHTAATADLTAAGNSTTVKLCGYLNKYKVGSRLSAGAIGLPVGLPKIFKKRWFVFSDLTCCLLYYRTPQDHLPLGEINIGQATFTFEPSSLLDGGMGDNRCNIFEIRSGGRKYWLEAQDRHTMLYWLQELQLCRRNYRKKKTGVTNSESAPGQGLISSDASGNAKVSNTPGSEPTLLLDNVAAPERTVGQSAAMLDEGNRLTVIKDFSVTNLKVELRNFVSSMGSNRLSKLSRGSSEDISDETSQSIVNPSLCSSSIPEVESKTSELTTGCHNQTNTLQHDPRLSDSSQGSFGSNNFPIDKNFRDDGETRRILREDFPREEVARGRLLSNLTGRLSFRRKLRINSPAVVRDKDSVTEGLNNERRKSSGCETCRLLEERIQQNVEEASLMQNEMEAMRDIIATFRVEMETLQQQLDTQKSLSGSKEIGDYLECIADKDRQIMRLIRSVSAADGRTPADDETVNETICELQQRLQEAEDELRMFRESVDCKDQIIMSLIDRISQLELTSEGRPLILAPPTDLQSIQSAAAEAYRHSLIGREKGEDNLLVNFEDSNWSTNEQTNSKEQGLPQQQQQQQQHYPTDGFGSVSCIQQQSWQQENQQMQQSQNSQQQQLQNQLLLQSQQMQLKTHQQLQSFQQQQLHPTQQQQQQQQQQHNPQKRQQQPKQPQEQHNSFVSQQQQVYSRLVKLISGGLINNSANATSAGANMGSVSGEEFERIKDQCRAYKLQNQFLNQEILEIDQLLKDEQRKYEQLHRTYTEMEALYYQVKSKHIYCLRELTQPSIDENFNQEIVSQLLKEALDSYDLANGPTDSSVSGVVCDEYGFDRQQEHIDLIGGLDSTAALAESLKQKCEQIENRSRKSDSRAAVAVKFERYLVATGDRPLAMSQDLKELIRGGVPYNLRGKVWKACIESRVNRMPGYYKKLVDKSTAARVHHQIEIDLLRTLPNNRHYASLQSDGIPRLRNVLLAFAVHNTQIGYCQGLNRLVAIMLLFLDEETTFWGLVTIIECIMPKCYYDHTLIAAHADQRVLKDFVQAKLPQMSAHFTSLNFDLSLFTFSWFLTVFIDNIPVETYLRVWDTFLYEGSKVLFRYTVAALKYNEEIIMQQRDLTSLHNLMRNIGSTLIDIDRLTKIAFHELNPFPMRLLTHKRNQHMQKLKVELAELETLRKSFEGSIKRYEPKEALSDDEN